jgi:hypothetical protein
MTKGKLLAATLPSHLLNELKHNPGHPKVS